jgi:uncharacterized protein YndB with AHSA1/START domain
MSDETTQAATHDVVATRVLDAPVEEVWRAWLEPELIKQWWGPTGFTVPIAEMDVREGGESLVSMAVPGFTVYNTWTYSRVVPHERLEFVNRFVDADRQVKAPQEFGIPPGVPREVPHVVTFRALPDGRTELTLTESGYETADAAAGSSAGLEQTFDKLAALVNG